MEFLGKKILSCCFTGYRPSKFPFTMDREDSKYKAFENSLIEELLGLVKQNCLIFYSGMAMGFDIIAAEAVLLLKNAYPKLPIKLVCVIPFEGQEDSFTSYWKERYYNVLENCDEKIVLSDSYFTGCYQKRNIFMVDNSDYVLTWYDGKSGGTRNTIDYALSKGRFILNINKSVYDNFAVQTTFEIF